MRQRIFNLAIIIVFLFLGLGLFNLEVLNGKKFKELSEKNCIRLIPQIGARGRIFDRNNNVIVDNNLTYDVMFLPQESRQLDKATTTALANLGIRFNNLKNDNSAPSSLPQILAKNISIKKVLALEELRQDSGSIIVQPHPLREYPHQRLACHVIGYLGEIDHWRLTKLADYGYKTKDIVGYTGIEERYDYYLRQEEGGLLQEVDHRGRFKRVVGFKPSRNGRDIQLTLDLNIQKIVEDSLKDKIGCVIIMEPYSGEIVAMTSSPNFDPTVFIKKLGVSTTTLFSNPEAPLLNRAISGVYPAGSVFKLVVAAAALETAKIKPSTTISCPGYARIGDQEFACWDKHGQQDLFNAIAQSCNTYFYKVGLLLGAQLIHDYALKFGLARPTQIDLPYEASGFIPDPLWKKIYKFKKWFDGDTANLSIGQGDVLVTPLQITRLMAIFANKGLLVTPYIVKAIGGRDISVYQKRTTKVSLKESTIDYINHGLRKAVSDSHGTANVLSSLPIEIAGKTGTAQVPRGQPHAWFVGFFPFKNPKFVICVFLEHGSAGHYAAVLAKEIIETMLQKGII